MAKAKTPLDQMLDDLLKGKSPQDGLLDELTKRLVERALEGELTDHLGYEKNAAAGRNGKNSRNGKAVKRVKTSTSEIDVEVPRDRGGLLRSAVAGQAAQAAGRFDDKVLALYARGLTTREFPGRAGRRDAPPHRTLTSCGRQRRGLRRPKPHDPRSAALIGRTLSEFGPRGRSWSDRPLEMGRRRAALFALRPRRLLTSSRRSLAASCG